MEIVIRKGDTELKFKSREALIDFLAATLQDFKLVKAGSYLEKAPNKQMAIKLDGDIIKLETSIPLQRPFSEINDIFKLECTLYISKVYDQS